MKNSLSSVNFVFYLPFVVCAEDNCLFGANLNLRHGQVFKHKAKGFLSGATKDSYLLFTVTFKFIVSSNMSSLSCPSQEFL